MTIPSLLGTPPLLVGRERELALLREHFNAALKGQGSLVLISGEAGIGKTSVAESICREAAEQGALILTGRSFDLAETPAYGPWLYLFERYHPDAALPAHPDAFARRGIVGEVPSQPALFRLVLDFLTTLTAQRPSVLLLDDLHWADPASLNLLRFLARSLDTLPLLVLVTYRADELTHPHPLAELLPILIREAHTVRLDLRALDNAAVHALVTARHPLAEADIRRLVAYLQDRGEGNAFYLSELLRSLEESSVLRKERARWTLGDLTNATVPPLLRRVIEGRLSRLDAECQGLLALAAVVGHEVPLAVWMAVSDADEETLLTVVAQGVRARLLVEMPDGARVQFSHALVREAIYEGVPAIQRRRLHQGVGDVLLAERQPNPDAVAYHFQRAGDARAADWLMRAAVRAYQAYAWETAFARDQAAMDLLEEQGADVQERAIVQFAVAGMRRYTAPRECIALLDKTERLAVEAGDRVLIYGARVGRGSLRCMLGDVERGLPEMIAAVELQESLTPAERVPHQMRGLWSGAMGPNAHGTVLLWLSNVGRYREAVAMRERFFAHSAPRPANRGGSAHGDGLLGLGTAFMALGRIAEARDALRQAREAYAEAGAYKMLAETAAAELRLILAFATPDRAARRQMAAVAEEALGRAGGAMGDIPAALLSAPLLLVEGQWVEARALIEHHGYAAVQIFSSHTDVVGLLMYLQGDGTRAWEAVRAMLPDGTATEPGTRRLTDTLGAQRLAVRLLLDAGNLPQAREWLDAQQAWMDWSGVVLGLSEGEALWAQYYRQAGEAERAFEHAECSLCHATEPRQPLALLTAHRLLGELATAAGCFDDATTHLDVSLQLAEACAAPYERALTLLARAELLDATGDHAEASVLLDAVRAICTPLYTQPTLSRADALAARLPARTGSAPTYPAGLSAREVEVLRLLTRGMSSRVIARELFVSVRTIERHIRNLYTKIGAHNRADATAFAFRHDLT